MRKLFIVLLGICLFSFNACSPSVTRIDEDQVVDLSGNWNDTDSRLVSDQMIKQLLEDSWLRLFTNRQNRKPIVQIGRVLNKTTEHIATGTFVKDIERRLLESNEVDLVAAGEAKQEAREEREDFATHNLHPAGTKIEMEKQADFILRCSIQSIEDQVTDTKVIYYQIDLELVSIANNEKTWIGQKRIKKTYKKPLVTW